MGCDEENMKIFTEANARGRGTLETSKLHIGKKRRYHVNAVHAKVQLVNT